MMSKTTATLFDLDGVVIDTEPQYSRFWSEQAAKYRPDIPELDRLIKGRTLKEIFATYFDGLDAIQDEISREIAVFEPNMTFEFIPGVVEFIRDVRRSGVKTAIVTSSGEPKVAALKKAQPVMEELFDLFITADLITRSKPDPEGYLLAASKLGTHPENSFVLEDSFSGLEAGKAAGMRLVGLATTFPAHEIAGRADIVIPDFRDFTCEKLMKVRYRE